MNVMQTRLRLMVVASFVLLGASVAHGDEVTNWNAILERTVAPTPHFLQSRSAAIVQLAVFEAVNAIVGDYEPYLGTIDAPPWASPDAAAVAAAHRTLVTLHPEAHRNARRLAGRLARGDPGRPGQGCRHRGRRGRRGRHALPCEPTTAGTPSCPTRRGPTLETGSRRRPTSGLPRSSAGAR